MRTKNSSVKIDNLTSFIKSKLRELDAIYKKYGAELVITSGNDGKHWGSRKVKNRPPSWKEFNASQIRVISDSKHYDNDAIDIRKRSIPKEKFSEFIAEVRELFPEGTYDVVVEGNHIHIEFDVKITEQNSKPRKPIFEMAAIKPEDLNMKIEDTVVKLPFYYRNKRKFGLIGMVAAGLLIIVYPPAALLAKGLFAASVSIETAGLVHGYKKGRKKNERTWADILYDMIQLVVELIKKK